MDESSLRNYFRKVLGVAPGASRKELRHCRDKRAQFCRTMLVAPGAERSPQGVEAAKLAEQRLAITNSAYDCLSNSDKFRDFQGRLAAGEQQLPDLDSLLASMGIDNVKPVAARVLAKRQAQLQEKMERIVALATESVQKAGHDQALKLTQGKLPDADQFYDSVYKSAREAGNRTCNDEMSELAKSKLEVDDTFKSEIDSLVIDQAEMIAHKEYDRLEDRAAMSAPTPSMPRFVALTLSLIIMGLVVSVCFYGVTSQPTPIPSSQYPAVTAPNPATGPVAGASVAPGSVTPAPAYPTGAAAPLYPGGAAAPAPGPAANTMPAAPQTGIANSVFNKSVFGPANNLVQNQVTNQVNSGAAPVPVPAPVLHPITLAEVKEAEVVPSTAVTTPAPATPLSAVLVGNAGAAGMAGYPTGGTKAGGTLYTSGIDAAMKNAYGESLRDFSEAYAAGHSKEALYNEGVVLALQGQFQPAVEVYNQLLALNPTFPQALYNRGLSHQLLASAGKNKNIGEWRKQVTLAIKNYTLAVKAEPRMSQALYNRGLAYYDLGQMENASADFANASEQQLFTQAAGYNRDVIDMALKKRTAPPSISAPPAPVGPVGPPGPA